LGKTPRKALRPRRPPASIPPDSIPAPACLNPGRADILQLYQQAALGGLFAPDMAATNPRTKELIAALPETLKEMACVVTLPAALKIAERFGGTRIYLRRHPGEQCGLARLIGLRAARALGHHYAGEQVEVPRAAAVRRMFRDREIHAVRARGWAARRIAREYRLTPRQVRRILSVAREGHAQDRRKVSRAAAGSRGQAR
jgi:Mor family transcriptional regulator